MFNFNKKDDDDYLGSVCAIARDLSRVIYRAVHAGSLRDKQHVHRMSYLCMDSSLCLLFTVRLQFYISIQHVKYINAIMIKRHIIQFFECSLSDVLSDMIQHE